MTWTKRSKIRLLLTTSLLFPTFTPAATPAIAEEPVNGIAIIASQNIEPGRVVEIQRFGWSSFTTATYQWYRCDSPVDFVAATTNSVVIPSDCVEIALATNTTYTLSLSDEEKFVSAVARSGSEWSMARSLANFVLLNITGGAGTSDGLALVFSNGSVLPIRNSQRQIYWSNNNSSASSIPLIWAENVLISPNNNERIGSEWVFKGDARDAEWDLAQTEKILDNGTDFRAKTIFTKNFSGKTYELIMEISYTKPNQNMDIRLALNIPQGASHDVHMYYTMDMYLDSDDLGPGYTNLIGESRLVAQKNSTAFGGVVELVSSKFTSWLESSYFYVFGNGGANYGPGNADPNYPSVIETNPSTDAGVGVHWALGRSPGTIERSFQLTFADSRQPAIYSSYSAGQVQSGNQIYSNFSILNISDELIDDADIKIKLPNANYSSPITDPDCAIAATILVESGEQYLRIENQDIPSTRAICSIDVPTVFNSSGEKTINSTELITGTWKSSGTVKSFSNMLTSKILVAPNNAADVGGTTKVIEKSEQRCSGETIRINFKGGSSKLDKSMKKRIAKVSSEIKECNYTKIKLIGHTSIDKIDSPGYKIFRKNLSLNRAYSVKTEITKNLGKQSKNIKFDILGKSEKNPIKSNKFEKSRKANRRVEIVMSK